ncbi:hypothetical protein [Bradyrhizobium diazoefficiens]|nr:hypothetical protein [Bradyrhizobium diazoefficiens]
MLPFEQMAVAVQYAPRLDCALLVQCCNHTIDNAVELLGQAP